MSGGSSQPAGNTTTTTNSSPWTGQQPFLTGNTQSGGNGLSSYFPSGATLPGTNGVSATGNNSIPGVLPAAASLYQNYAPQYFPSSTVAPFNPTQEAGQALETNLGMNGTSSVGAANNGLTAINSGSLLGAGNPYFSDMAHNVMSQVVPGIESTFAGGNDMNEPGAAFATSQGAATALGNLAYQNYNDQIKNMLSGSAIAPTIQGANLQDAQMVQDAGGQQQQQAQAQLNDLINRFNFQQQLPYNMLNTYSGLVNGNFGGTNTTTQPYFGPTMGSQIMSGLGDAAALAAIYASSDRRLKTDIRRIGTADNGLPIYCYRYRGEITPHIGFMADEVEQIHPEAVIEGPFGFKMVNYGLASKGA